MYKFQPIIKNLVWGTETWVLSGVPGNESVVVEGAESGRTLGEVAGNDFPLLIKFIDARQDLSIQVHPDDALASKRHGSKGKTEMWYVISADEGARIISGLDKKISDAEFVSMVEQSRITEVLRNHEVRAGDVFFVPSGRIHAIGGGCRVAEIQQTSDITYRIFDYNRPGLDGKPRQLHTEQAREAIDYNILPDYKTHYRHCAGKAVTLVTCQFFRTRLLELEKPYHLVRHSSFIAVVCLEGKASFGDTVLKEGEAGLILKEKSVEIVPSDFVKLLISEVPQS